MKKISDVALCLIWVNHDCEIATLDEKYLRLSGTVDPATHEWHVKDHAKLDALLQMADIGARHGIAFAAKAEIDPSILAMIYERAAHQRIENDDASALDSLRNYWRCALLGNVCWQLAHTPKAQPVDLGKEAPPKDGKKPDATATTGTDDKSKTDGSPSTSTNSVVKVNPPTAETTTNEIVTANPATPTNTDNIPVAPIATNELDNPVPEPNYGGEVPTPAPTANAPVPPSPPAVSVAPSAPAPVVSVAPSAPAPANEDNIPVAPIATNTDNIPVAPIATNMTDAPAPPVPVAVVQPSNPAPAPAPAPTPTPAPAPAPAPAPDEANIPVAPIAKVQDYSSGDAPPTNAAPPAPAPAPTQ